MNNSFARLVDGMCATLRTEVLTRLDDEFARGQVFGVINLLNTFKARADWAPEWLALQIAAQQKGLGEARAVLADVGGAPAVPEQHAPPATPAAELLVQRDEGNRLIAELLRWASEHRASLSPEQQDALERGLREAMRTEIALELKYSPRPLFSEMSSGQEDAPR